MMGFNCVLKVKFLPVLLMGLIFVCSVIIILRFKFGFVC